MPTTPRTYLGFDFGTQKIGLAVGQTLTGTATALTTLPYQGTQPNWDSIAALIQQWNPMALIVGLPLHQDGTEYELSKRAQKFGRRLQGRFNLPVYWVDERLSTYAAKQQPSLEDHRPHKVSNWDALAAKFILESWMAQNVDET